MAQNKKYKVICTHNPQDFFNGCEAPELVEELDNVTLPKEIMDKSDEGYKVIILPGGDTDG